MRLVRRPVPDHDAWPQSIPSVLRRVFAARRVLRLARALISHDKYAYPRVRVAVLACRQPAGDPKYLSELNRSLRQENAALRRTVKLARESLAAMALRMERVVRNAEREFTAARRREKRGDRDPNHVAGLSSVLPASTDGVVREFKPERSKDS